MALSLPLTTSVTCPVMIRTSAFIELCISINVALFHKTASNAITFDAATFSGVKEEVQIRMVASLHMIPSISSGLTYRRRSIQQIELCSFGFFSCPIAEIESLKHVHCFHLKRGGNDSNCGCYWLLIVATSCSCISSFFDL